MSDYQRGEAEGTILGIFVVLVFIICWIAFGDSTQEAMAKAKSAVEDSGFSSVVIEGPAILACDTNDTYRYYWKGNNQAGKEVRGQACAGAFFKGWTVRLGR